MYQQQWWWLLLVIIILIIILVSYKVNNHNNSNTTVTDGDDNPSALWGWNQGSGVLDNGIPSKPANTQNTSNNACDPNSGGTENGFVCPHMALLTDDMLRASRYDGNDGWALYGVCGAGQDGDCGKCFQLQIQGGGDITPYTEGKQLIVQVVNSGGDVASGQFDVFMGAGGFGVFNGCTSDCQTNGQCSKCRANLYDGDFAAWTKGGDGGCYGGGVRMVTSSYDDIVSTCNSLTTGNEFKDIALKQSCIQTNLHKLHQNFGFNGQAVKWVQVQCPKGLAMASGIQRSDDSSNPVASSTLQATNPGKISTMQDCCKVSCAWTGKVSTTPGHPVVYTCNSKGMPLLQS